MGWTARWRPGLPPAGQYASETSPEPRYSLDDDPSADAEVVAPTVGAADPDLAPSPSPTGPVVR